MSAHADNKRGRARKRNLTPILFLAPFAVVFLVFVVYPLGQSVVLAFEQTYGPKSRQWVGFDNFRALLSDPLYWLGMRNTFLLALASLFIQLPLSLGLALLLNRPEIRGRLFFRAVFFAPSLVGFVFVALLFSPVFEKEHRAAQRHAACDLA